MAQHHSLTASGKMQRKQNTTNYNQISKFSWQYFSTAGLPQLQESQTASRTKIKTSEVSESVVTFN